MNRKTLGYVCLIGFLACIWLANYSITHWGHQPFPGGPHTVTLLGLTAPSGVLFVGLTFSLRDGAQMALTRWHILAAIIAGAVLSYFVTTGAEKIAVASGLAFLFSETCDWLVYTPLVERGRVTAAVTFSNTVGAAIDSLLFLWVAFGSLDFFWGNFWLKLLMTIPALMIVVPLRVRRAVTV